MDAAVVDLLAEIAAELDHQRRLGQLGARALLRHHGANIPEQVFGAALVAGSLTRPELALSLVAVAGFVHGHAHGVEAPTAAAPVAYVIGFVAATAGLHAAGVGMGQLVIRRPAVRAALGSVVIGAGVAFAAGIV